MREAINIIQTDWATHSESLSLIRKLVFIEEQRVPVELEWDGEDPGCRHVLAMAKNELPVATGRLLKNGHIGRMAVLSEYRRQGIGSNLLKLLITMARNQGNSMVFLHAQESAIGFYSPHRFEKQGKIFMDAGIPHVKMIRNLD